MIKPEVSIIILNYNTKETTANCVKSLISHTKSVRFEIILIDNASVDGSFEYLSKQFAQNSKIELVKSRENKGFSNGNNLGVGMAKGKYVLFLNSDTLIKDNVIGEFTLWMKKHKDVGIATCMLRNKDGSIQGTGGYFPTLMRVFSWMTIEDIPLVDRLIKPFHPHRPKWFLKNDFFYTQKAEVDWVTGAFMFVRKKVIDEIGGLDEDYFMYTEDTDFCYRAKKAGWKVVYNPKWSIVHLGGTSSNAEYPIISEYKSLKLFYKKHFPSWQYPLLRFFLKTGALLRIIAFCILSGKEAATTYAKAFREA